MLEIEASRSPKPTAAQRRAAGRAEQAAAATAHLTAADPRFAGLIARVGPYRPIITRDPFIALAGSITHQQVSMAAAATIFRRLCDLCPRRRPTPVAVAALRKPALRRAGLSRQKAAYLHDLAAHFNAGRLSAARLRRLPDEDVIDAVTQVHGIGRWTAEMLLIFSLERPDVWPVDDLGLRKAMQRFLDLPAAPSPKSLHAPAEPWRPYRSVATWYLWRSLDGALLPGISL